MRLTRVTLLAVILLLVAACAGDGGTAGTDQPSDPTSGQDAADEAMDDALEGGDVDLPTGDEDMNDARDAFSGGTEGTVTLNGESQSVSVLRCEPFSFGDDPHEDDLSVVVALAGGGMSGMNIDLTFTDTFDMTTGEQFLQERLEVFLSTSTSDGTYQYEAGAHSNAAGVWFPGDDFLMEGDPLPGSVFEISGNRFSGSMTVFQNWPEGMDGVVDVTFDLEIPTEFHPDC